MFRIEGLRSGLKPSSSLIAAWTGAGLGFRGLGFRGLGFRV